MSANRVVRIMHASDLNILCAVQTPQWYMQNYPDGAKKVLGFLDYHIIYTLQLDHIYTSYYFVGLCTLLAASLVACSRTQQIPLVKMAQRWKFAKTPKAVFAKGHGVPSSLQQYRCKVFAPDALLTVW